MPRKRSLAKTLGTVSASFINTLQNHGQTVFTIDEAQKIYGKNRYATGDFLSELVKRGVLARVKSGVYLVLQAGHENTQLNNWPIIARELMESDMYFLSYYSAMRLNAMTTHPLFDVYITTPKRKKTRKISNITYHFIYSKKNHFWGATSHWVTKQDYVKVSDVERTILDGLDRPDLCGGLTEVVRGIWAKQKEMNACTLLKYVKKFRTKAAVKRLGFILETFDFDSNVTNVLAKEMSESKDYIFLDPDSPKVGKYLSRWRVCLNTNIEALKASVWG
jgi:predicted transcriptional regulator of viral defense system